MVILAPELVCTSRRTVTRAGSEFPRLCHTLVFELFAAARTCRCALYELTPVVAQVPAWLMYGLALVWEWTYAVLANLPSGPWTHWEPDMGLTRAEVCKVRGPAAPALPSHIVS